MTTARTALEAAPVLVTGARGFLGRHLVPRLLELGAEVHAVSRRRQPNVPGPVWHAADLTDPEAVDRLVTRVSPECVFHLAGFVTGVRDLASVRDAFSQNAAASVWMLGAAQLVGCRRIVLAGSQEEPSGSSWPPVPSSPYAAAKFAASSYARFFHALYGTPVVIARIFMVYGPDQPDESKMVPYVIRGLLAGESPRLSSGRRRVDWIYVDDVVEGLLALATTPGVEGETFELGTGELTSVREVAKQIHRLVGADTPLELDALPDRPLEPEVAAAIEGTTRRTGWRPKLTLPEGLTRTVDWYRRYPSNP